MERGVIGIFYDYNQPDKSSVAVRQINRENLEQQLRSEHKNLDIRLYAVIEIECKNEISAIEKIFRDVFQEIDRFNSDDKWEYYNLTAERLFNVVNMVLSISKQVISFRV